VFQESIMHDYGVKGVTLRGRPKKTGRDVMVTHAL